MTIYNKFNLKIKNFPYYQKITYNYNKIMRMKKKKDKN